MESYRISEEKYLKKVVLYLIGATNIVVSFQLDLLFQVFIGIVFWWVAYLFTIIVPDTGSHDEIPHVKWINYLNRSQSGFLGKVKNDLIFLPYVLLIGYLLLNWLHPFIIFVLLFLFPPAVIILPVLLSVILIFLDYAVYRYFGLRKWVKSKIIVRFYFYLKSIVLTFFMIFIIAFFGFIFSIT